MKKSITITAAILLVGISSHAQTNIAVLKADQKQLHAQEKSIRHEMKEEKATLRKQEENEVAYASKEQFAKDFGSTTAIAWRREGNFDVAEFMNDGVKQSAFYDPESKLIGVTSKKAFTDLPLQAQSLINRKYKDYTKEAVILFDDNQENQTDMILFGHSFEDADNYFVELSKDNKRIVLKCDMEGRVSYFCSMK